MGILTPLVPPGRRWLTDDISFLQNEKRPDGFQKSLWTLAFLNSRVCKKLPPQSGNGSDDASQGLGQGRPGMAETIPEQLQAQPQPMENFTSQPLHSQPGVWHPQAATALTLLSPREPPAQ